MLEPRSQRTFSGKGQRINIIGFVGHRVVVPTITSTVVALKQP